MLMPYEKKYVNNKNKKCPTKLEDARNLSVLLAGFWYWIDVLGNLTQDCWPSVNAIWSHDKQVKIFVVEFGLISLIFDFYKKSAVWCSYKIYKIIFKSLKKDCAFRDSAQSVNKYLLKILSVNLKRIPDEIKLTRVHPK